MKVRLLRSVAVSGVHYDADSVADLDEATSAELIGMGKAIPAKSNRAVGLPGSDAPKPKTRTKRG